MFKDRFDAGQKLGRALEKYKDKNVLILAIPRGGVEVAGEVAKYLDAELSLIITKKLPYPDNPEAGFGAVAEDGSTFIFEYAKNYIPQNVIDEIIKRQKKDIAKKIKILRDGKPLPDISGKTVILIDDGLAMGVTMRAAINLCIKKKAGKIIVAVPVSGEDVARGISALVDELVVLEVPEFFQAVAQVYENWHDATEEEIIKILKNSEWPLSASTLNS